MYTLGFSLFLPLGFLHYGNKCLLKSKIFSVGDGFYPFKGHGYLANNYMFTYCNYANTNTPSYNSVFEAFDCACFILTEIWNQFFEIVVRRVLNKKDCKNEKKDYWQVVTSAVFDRYQNFAFSSKVTVPNKNIYDVNM